jgi:rhamnosyl/mannosyltransferase
MIDRESGILVPPGDARALAKAMIVLAENPQLRRQMGEAALKRYRTLFSPDAVVPLMLETYSRVAARATQARPSQSNHSDHPWSRCH